MKRSQHRRKVLGAIALTATLALGACAQPPEAAQSPEAEVTQPPVSELTVWMFASQLIDPLEVGFSEAYPNYDVEIVEIPAGDITQRLVVALQGGEGLPDVVLLPLRNSTDLLATGQFLDLSAELEPLRGDFVEGGLVETQGQVNSFVMAPGNMGLWVNEGALNELGIELPADPTWDEMVDVARELRDASNGEKYLFIQPPGPNGFNMYNAYYHSRGGEWWSEDGDLIADAELAADTLEFFVNLDQEGLLYRGWWGEPTFWEEVNSERVMGFAMNYAVGSTNLQREVPELSGDWSLVTWPRWSPGADQKTGAFGGLVFLGLKDATNPQGAKDLILWLLSDEGLQAQRNGFGLVTYDVDNPLVNLAEPVEYFGGQEVAADLASVPFSPFTYLNWSQTESALIFAIDQALSGAATPQEAIDAALDELRGQ